MIRGKYIDDNYRPTKYLTDKIWQKMYISCKENIVPYKDGNKKKLKYKTAKSETDMYGNYLPDERTNYQLYCQFINSILSEIRKGNKTFVFFTYQIEQILHFHYEDLKTKYVNGFWEIWLENDNEKQTNI